MPRLSDASEGVPRFGDSTWVAPVSSFDGDPTSEGPRVAPRDHERRWETALRAPFRIAFLPLRLVARGLEEGVGRYGGRVMSPGPKHVAKGLSVTPALDVGGVSEIGVGPSFLWSGFPSGDSKLHLSGTWSTIDRRRIKLRERIGEQRPVGFVLRADYDYKPNLKFYGIGNETPVSCSDTFQSRRRAPMSCERSDDSTRFGYPVNSNGPSGPRTAPSNRARSSTCSC